MNTRTFVFKWEGEETPKIVSDCYDEHVKYGLVVGISSGDEISRVEYLEGLLDKSWIDYD